MRKVFLTVFLLVGCGRYTPGPSPYTPVVPVPAPTEKVIVAVFGAPWCEYCKLNIPKLDGRLKKLPQETRDRIDFRYYMVTGASAQVPPTQADAEIERNFMGISATAFADPWKWTTFRKWVGGSFVIPAAAILTKDEKILKQFRGGIDPVDVAEAARRAVEGN